MATLGAVSNPDNMNQNIGKAGRSRWLGRRPHNRGVVMNPVDHPHGGGEGRTWAAGTGHAVGQADQGLQDADNKRTDSLIIRRRKVGGGGGGGVEEEAAAAAAAAAAAEGEEGGRRRRGGGGGGGGGGVE